MIRPSAASGAVWLGQWLIRRMRRAGQMLAIVMREDREVGLVSMQDILSQVFGEVKL